MIISMNRNICVLANNKKNQKGEVLDKHSLTISKNPAHVAAPDPSLWRNSFLPEWAHLAVAVVLDYHAVLAAN